MERASLTPTQVDAVVFDVIGTLVNEDATWERAAGRLASESGVHSKDLAARWAKLLQLKMDAVVLGESPWRPHRELVIESAREAIAGVGGSFPLDASSWVEAFGSNHTAWPDVAAATADLRRDRLVAGVSNGDLDSLARLANANSISWDIVLSAGTVRTFKPAPAAYRYAIDGLRIEPQRTLFVAAHPWDLRAASEHGFRTAYVARPGAERPAEGDHFDLEVDNLTDLASFLAP